MLQRGFVRFAHTILSGFSTTGWLHTGKAENPVVAQPMRLGTLLVSVWY